LHLAVEQNNSRNNDDQNSPPLYNDSSAYVAIEEHAFRASTTDPRRKIFLLDSGATCHMFQTNDFMFHEVPDNTKINAASSSTITAMSKGSASIPLTDSNSKECCVIANNVLYVPELSAILISAQQLTESGWKNSFEKDRAVFFDQLGREFHAIRDNKSYIFVLETSTKDIFAPFYSWQLKLGHMSLTKFKLLARSMPILRTVKRPPSLRCDTCSVAKMTKTPYP
jgi:hypothetical protein